MNYTVKQISEASGISTQAVYQHIKIKEINPIDIRHKTSYYSEEDALRILQIVDPDADIERLHKVANSCKEVAKHDKAEVNELQHRIEMLESQLAEVKEDKQQYWSKIEAWEQKYAARERKHDEDIKSWEKRFDDFVSMMAKQPEQIVTKESEKAADNDNVIDTDNDKKSELTPTSDTMIPQELNMQKRSFWQRLRDAVNAFRNI